MEREGKEGFPEEVTPELKNKYPAGCWTEVTRTQVWIEAAQLAAPEGVGSFPSRKCLRLSPTPQKCDSQHNRSPWLCSRGDVSIKGASERSFRLGSWSACIMLLPKQPCKHEISRKWNMMLSIFLRDSSRRAVYSNVGTGFVPWGSLGCR